MRIAIAQLAVDRDVAVNVAAILRAVEFAAAEGADILLTPEGSLSGYTPRVDQPAVERALARVTDAAATARLGLALGTCFIEPEDGLCYNQLRFHDRSGAYLGFHSKTLRCGSLDDPPQGEINDYAARPLRTFDFEGVTIGGLICNDLWANPACTPMPDTHLTQQFAGMGARIIFHAVNGGRDGSEWAEVTWRYHESNLLMRARAAGAWIVTADSAAPVHLPCSAPSGIVGPDGRWICRTEPVGEQMVACTIDIDT